MARKTQADKAYISLKNNLLARNIEEGERLSEKFWADKLDVNRGDIRSALARLFSDGLAVKGEKGGFFAREYSQLCIEQLNEARTALEISAAMIAIKKANEQDFQELKDICESMHNMAKNGYMFGFSEADVHFHATFVKASHNPKLIEIYETARIPVTATRKFLDIEETKDELAKIANEHCLIFKYLKDKDLEKLIALIRDSIR